MRELKGSVGRYIISVGRGLRPRKMECLSRMRLISLLLVWLLLAGIAAGQVLPTLPRGPLYSGPPLTGITTETLRDPTGTNLGNLYVTGQVTNGASFKAAIPYGPTNQMELTLPTEQLDNFRRNSFGLDRYRGGVNYYSPQPFYRPSNTVYSSADAAAGLLKP